MAATRPCLQWMGGEAKVSRGAAARMLGAWLTATSGQQGKGARGVGAPGCRVVGVVGCVGTGAGSEASKKEKGQGRGRRGRTQGRKRSKEERVHKKMFTAPNPNRVRPCLDYLPKVYTLFYRMFDTYMKY